MNVSVKIELDKRNQKKNGTYPLKLLIVVGRDPFRLPLGYSLYAKDWSERGQKVKASCKTLGSTTRINALLQQEKSKVMNALTKLESEGRLETFTTVELKQYLKSDQTDLMTIKFGEHIVNELKEAHKHGNARVYDTMLRSIKDFTKGKDIPMKKISYAWLKKYETWYYKKGNTVNGLAFNLRTLHALFNRAIKRKLISGDYYPFKEYKINHEKTRKRAISQADIQKIKSFIPTTERQARAKDYFMISFYLMGASFVDIAYLKISDIVNGRIEYKRKKTGKLHSIPVSLPLKALLGKYMDGKGKDDFIFNVIKSNDPQMQIINVRDEMRRYNRSLKEIGVLCGIDANLTSYVSRHSYATIAKYKGVPTAIISEALGHSSEEVTQIYLDSFENAVLDKYHEIIIE